MDLKVTRMKVGDQVYEGMLAMILDGRLPQGSRIDYGVMAETFNTSRLPLREAVQRLSADGLIETKPNGGTYVIKLTHEEIVYLFGVRRIIEVEAVNHRFEKINRDRIMELKEIFEEEAKLLEQDTASSTANDMAERVAYSDLLLHREIVMGNASNRVISHFSTLVFNYTQLAQRMNVRSASSNKEHMRIIKAILANDQDLTAKAVSQHLKNVEDSILQGLAE